jgi:ATP-dependent DNA ligase
VAAVSLLKATSCHIDGEVIVCDDNGLANFKMLLRGSQSCPFFVRRRTRSAYRRAMSR